MRSNLILKELKKAVEVISPHAVVILPNEPVAEDANNAELYFEISVSGQDYHLETEASTFSSALASIVIVGKRNTGAGRLDDLAEHFVQMFSPIDPVGRNFSRSLYVEESEKVTYVYVKNVERSEAGIYDGRYKLTIFISLDVYEDRKYVWY